MSDKVRAWVLEHYHSQNRRSASQRKFLLYTLASAVNDRGWGVGESVAALAAKVDQDERQVRRHLRALEAEGVLECAAQVHGASPAPHLYRVYVPWVPRDDALWLRTKAPQNGSVSREDAPALRPGGAPAAPIVGSLDSPLEANDAPKPPPPPVPRLTLASTQELLRDGRCPSCAERISELGENHIGAYRAAQLGKKQCPFFDQPLEVIAEHLALQVST